MEGKRYRIVYEDAQLMIVDKPSGMLVIPTPRGETNTLVDAVNRDLDSRGVEINAYPCHRLDRETSGLVIFAKGKSVQKLVMDSFKRRLVRKAYMAFVHGNIGENFGVIRKAVYNNNKKRNEDAVTKFRVLERRKNFTIVEAEPVTGRTNQIRIHFKKIGHPLVGESVYAFRKDFRLKFKRAALHAKSVEFTHPVTGQRLKLEASLSEDMKSFLNPSAGSGFNPELLSKD